MNDIELIPNPARVMEGLRDTGYDFNTAIADIVDNSIAADATKIVIRLDNNSDMSGNIVSNVLVSIADNGCGMDEVGLRDAMRYGSPAREDPASLGKFGLGLKTASTAFCRCLSVISRGGDLKVRKVQWDIDHIIKTGQWNLKQLPPTEEDMELLNEVTSSSQTGTVVTWENIDRLFIRSYVKQGSFNKAFIKKIEELKFHLSMIYQRFLDKENKNVRNIEIYVNDDKISPWDPFCTKEKSHVTTCNEELVIEIQKNEEYATETQKKDAINLKIIGHLLPKIEDFSSSEAAKISKVDANDMQGLYIYRENRLIHYGDWMRMFANEPHSKLLRVDISFDNRLDDIFNVDIKKSRIILNDDLYYEIKKILGPSRRAANDLYRSGVKKSVAEKGKESHNSSDRNIEQKAPSLEESKVKILNEEKGEVEVTNKNGVFKHKITIRHKDESGKMRIIPVDSIENALLWRPVLVDSKKAIEINTGHEYYQKVYYPLLSRKNSVIGMDALLWSLGEAEISTMNDQTARQYQEMRIMVSHFLRELVCNLPSPDVAAPDGEQVDDEILEDE